LTQVVLLTYLLSAPGFRNGVGNRIVDRVDDYPMGTPALWFHMSLPT
jgi:hypothetical protein